jgi:GNAT superfamily N-acetyltransferase
MDMNEAMLAMLVSFDPARSTLNWRRSKHEIVTPPTSRTSQTRESFVNAIQPKVSFIRYQPEYQEPLLALHRSAMEGFSTGMTRDEEEADLLTIEATYLRSGGEFLVGFSNQMLVAMGGFQRFRSSTAELRRMRIHREHQGRGYGTHLLHELERRAHQSGIGTLQLETACSRPLTLAFYRKHRYVQMGLGRYGNVETVQFAKVLLNVGTDNTP